MTKEECAVAYVTMRLTGKGIFIKTQAVCAECGKLFGSIPTRARFDGTAWRWRCSENYRNEEFYRGCKVSVYLPAENV